MRVIQTILERIEKSMLKCYGYVVRVEGNRWHKRIMTVHRKEDDDEDEPKYSWKTKLRG